VDLDEVFYLTDTGRRWDGDRVSVRDKVNAGMKDSLAQSRRDAEKGKNRFEHLRFRSTFDIIAAAEKGLLPDKIMINTHPQRWTDDYVPWVKELVWQNVKNVIKKGLVSRPG
jgi:hypothetical protein